LPQGFLRDTTSTPPLLAAAGGVETNSIEQGEFNLTQADLDLVVGAAIEYWASAGLSATQFDWAPIAEGIPENRKNNSGSPLDKIPKIAFYSQSSRLTEGVFRKASKAERGAAPQRRGLVARA
jgi:hypothetical protein